LWLGRLLYRLEIIGSEHIPRTGAFIITGLHISRADGFYKALGLCLRPDLQGLPPDITLLNRRRAWLFRALGIIPLYKGRGLSRTSLQKALEVLRQGRPLMTGVEGEITWDGRLQPLREGVAWLALRANVPVVVCALRGGYDVWPRWAKRPHLTGKLILRIGRPLSLCDAPCERISQAMIRRANERIAAEMITLYQGGEAQSLHI
jgi:1-acyl-sn-glycerol-3-phosphate acyltransferase